jgi:N-acetylgalactosamine PTS system EIIA component
MIHGILVTHGSIGAALIGATRGFIGTDDGLHALDVTQLSTEDISVQLLSLLDKLNAPDNGVVIMTSMKGGSCWNVSATVAQSESDVKVIAGVNLPMVLTFMTKRDFMDLEALTRLLVEETLKSITLLS